MRRRWGRRWGRDWREAIPLALTTARGVRVGCALLGWRAESAARRAELAPAVVRDFLEWGHGLGAGDDLALAKALYRAGARAIPGTDLAGPGVRLLRPTGWRPDTETGVGPLPSPAHARAAFAWGQDPAGEADQPASTLALHAGAAGVGPGELEAFAWGGRPIPRPAVVALGRSLQAAGFRLQPAENRTGEGLRLRAPVDPLHTLALDDGDDESDRDDER